MRSLLHRFLRFRCKIAPIRTPGRRLFLVIDSDTMDSHLYNRDELIQNLILILIFKKIVAFNVQNRSNFWGFSDKGTAPVVLGAVVT
jgi:hypothetical protein